MALHKLILPTRSGNLMFPVALFFGGIVQFLAGILILFNGDSFNGSVFVTYGSYWIGAGTMMVPNVGALFDVYDLANERNLTAAIYMFMWAAFALMITLISVRIKGGSLLGTWCLFFVFLNLFLEGIYDMTLNSAMMRASGVACAMACLGGYYSGIVDLFAEQGSVLWCGKYKSRL
jgi:succinate-acetate transporter protein